MATSFHQLLIDAARAEGFPEAGALDIDLAREAMTPHVARYDDWIARGHAGEMGYLVRGRDRRADPRLVFPEVRSVLCVISPYDRRAAGAAEPAEGPRYARYLRQRDYHAEIAERLDAAMERAQAALAASGDPEALALKWKTCVDTSAVLERSWAQLAGLGWIGKNTMLIHPRLGSYFFIGTVLINRETNRGPAPLPDFCGHCRRCLDGCPTGAIEEPHRLNANRCISYWTLEKRGELPITDEQRAQAGRWVAGCDVCQEVCPFNRKPAREDEARGPSTAAEDAAIAVKRWEELLAETENEYRARVRDSSLSRVKPAQARRNLALGLTGALGALADDDALRAFWARHGAAIRARAAAESDAAAGAEWRRLLDRAPG